MRPGVGRLPSKAVARGKWNDPCFGLAKKFVWFFPCDGSSSAYLSLTLFKTILLECIVSALISAYI